MRRVPPVTAYLIDWASLLLRWLHVVAGIAWIGSSFYFIWLNNHLLQPENPGRTEKGVAGELWSVHGGAFYRALKYQVAPARLPKPLHWFYREAYATFVSGMLLLCLVYYGHAEIYLIDPAVTPLSKPVAIAIGIGFIACGWLVYDALCRTRLARNDRAMGLVLGALLAAAAWMLCHLFSGRGAFIQFGAMLGTIMVANVFFVIIPGQRTMVRALQAGREPDLEVALRSRLRSTHNTYFTLPVLFTMISNHYATMFGARHNGLVLIALSAAGVLIRVYFVNRHSAETHNGRTSPLPAALAALLLAGLAFMLVPARSASDAGLAESRTPAEQFARVQSIVHYRCAICHRAIPDESGFSAAPAGVRLDAPELILVQATRIQTQLATRAMPVGNVTGLTEGERSELLAWIQRGAPH